MYSPKIREELVSRLYVMAKERKTPMTKLVNAILQTYLEQPQRENENGSNKSAFPYPQEPTERK